MEPLEGQKMNSRGTYFSDKNYRNSLLAHFRNKTSDAIKNKKNPKIL